MVRIQTRPAAIFLTLIAVALSGCGSMTGFTESSATFGCKAPKGVSCKSVSGVYANAQAARGALSDAGAAVEQSATLPVYAPEALPVAMPGMPIRSQPQMLRVWTSPWVDEDGDLHDQSYLYLVPSQGRWMVEQTREATVQRTLHRLRPPAGPSRTDEAARQTPTQDDRAYRSAEGLAEASAQVGSR